MAARLKRGFYWRGNTIWVRSDPFTGKRSSTGCSDPRAAELWDAERQRLAASAEYRASTTATIGGWVRRVLAIKKAERSGGTLHMYEVKLGHVARLFGKDSPMSTVTAPTVDAYIAARRKEGAGSNTIARELTCLRQVLRYSKRANEYAGDIATVMPIGFASEYVPVTRTLKRDDLPKLLTGLQDDTERAWVCMALTFAADAADIERMRPEDYDKATGLMHIRGTKNRARDAWLPVLPLFQALFDFGLARLPLSWPNASGGVGRACKRAGISHLSPKDLRRSTITWLAEGGVSQDIASRFARHIGDQMVRKIYAQIAPRSLGSLINAQLGTEASHPLTGPLGGKADAGDLKGHKRDWRGGRRQRSPEKTANQIGVAGREKGGNGTPFGTPTSHHVGGWVLALAAQLAVARRARMGRLPGVVRVALWSRQRAAIGGAP